MILRPSRLSGARSFGTNEIPSVFLCGSSYPPRLNPFEGYSTFECRRETWLTFKSFTFPSMFTRKCGQPMQLLQSGVLKKSPSNASLKANAVKIGTSRDLAWRASYCFTLKLTPA